MSPIENHFGKYELVDRIAAGGMAEIYKARYAPAPGVTKQVVIKKILPHYAENKAFIGMFTNEARIAMGLSHGNIAQVFDFGSIDGDYFLAMEFVDGQPLSKVLKRAQTLGLALLPTWLSAFIVAETLKGLHYAHTRLDEQGRPMHIVHRDVSPQNVLVSYEAQIKVVDFGIARARTEGVKQETNANAMKGKYVYFSPEQARAKDLDARSDVFAAGVVLYELVTGELPFQGKPLEALTKLVRGEFQRPRELNRNLSVELERIVLKALALDRDDRYASAEAFQEELTRYLAQSHSDFQPSELSLLMQLLFEEELVKSGRPVQLSRTFIERAQSWKRPIEKTEEEEAPTEMMPMGEEISQAAPVLVPIIAAPSTPGGAAPQKRPRLLRGVVMTTAAILIGFIGVFLGTRSRPGVLEIDSTPSGAQVTLDGREVPGVTPLIIDKLEGDRQFHVEVVLPRFVKWTNDVPLRRGQRLQMNAALVAEPPPPPPPPVPDLGALIELPAPAAPLPPPDEVTWPAPVVKMDLARQHLNLAVAGATRLKLDATVTWRVSLSRGTTPGWGFYVVNDSGATPVAFDDLPLEIKGASSLYAFHVPLVVLGAAGSEEKRARSVTAQALGQRRMLQEPVPTSLEVGAATHVTLRGLAAARTYEVTPRHGSPGARLRTGAALLKELVMGTRDGIRVIPFDQPTRLEGVEAVIFMVVHDVAQPSGLIEVEVRELPGPRRKHR